jgi:hypothetical protein
MVLLVQQRLRHMEETLKYGWKQPGDQGWKGSQARAGERGLRGPLAGGNMED